SRSRRERQRLRTTDQREPALLALRQRREPLGVDAGQQLELGDAALARDPRLGDRQAQLEQRALRREPGGEVAAAGRVRALGGGRRLLRRRHHVALEDGALALGAAQREQRRDERRLAIELALPRERLARAQVGARLADAGLDLRDRRRERDRGADHLLHAAGDAGERIDVRQVLLAREIERLGPSRDVAPERRELWVGARPDGEQERVVGQRPRLGQVRRRQRRVRRAADQRVEPRARRGEL